MTTPAKQTSAQFAPLGTVSAPADWNIPSNIVLSPSVVFAHFDGTSATGSFVPTLQILSDSGHVVAEIPQDVTVAAGASCEATWAPFLRTQSAAASLSLTITDVGLQAETLPIWLTASTVVTNAAGQLFTQIFPYAFAAGTTLAGAFFGQWSNSPTAGTGHITYGLCDGTGKVLATTGNLGSSFWTSITRLLTAPFTVPLTLTKDTTLYGWCHGFTGTWNSPPGVAASTHPSTFLQQASPDDWLTVLGAFPPQSTNAAFGSTAPALGATIALNGSASGGAATSIYMGVY